MITSSGQKLAVEIKVTHEVGLKKRVMFRKETFSAIEIDLSHLSNMTSEPTRESITADICDSTKYIKWVFNEKRNAEIQRSIGTKQTLPILQEIENARKVPKRSKSHIYPSKPWAKRRNSKDRISNAYKLRNRKPRKYICTHNDFEPIEICLGKCLNCQNLVTTNPHKWQVVNNIIRGCIVCNFFEPIEYIPPENVPNQKELKRMIEPVKTDMYWRWNWRWR